MVADPAAPMVKLRQHGDGYSVAVEPPTYPDDALQVFECKDSAWSWASRLWTLYRCGFDDETAGHFLRTQSIENKRSD